MPYGTNSRFDASQAINCLATIVVSRDQSASIRSLSRHSEAAADSSAVGLLLRVSFSSPDFLIIFRKSLAKIGLDGLSL